MQISNSIIHTAQYYETDSMKIVHHANYIKWMEEARLNYFKQAGFDWKKMETSTGIMIPVLFQSVEYKQMIKFDEEIEVVCVCDKFNGVKMNFSYIFQSQGGSALKAVGITKHGFIDARYEPIALQEKYLDGYRVLQKYINS